MTMNLSPSCDHFARSTSLPQWRWYADESPLNDLDDAEDSIDAMDDELADALAELLDEPAPLADPGTP